MKDWLTVIALNVVMVTQIMAVLVVAFGTIQAFVHSLRAMVSPSATGQHFHSGYVQYARWLIAGLTFQLAADIIDWQRLRDGENAFAVKRLARAKRQAFSTTGTCRGGF